MLSDATRTAVARKFLALLSDGRIPLWSSAPLIWAGQYLRHNPEHINSSMAMDEIFDHGLAWGDRLDAAFVREMHGAE
ncbi:MAG: hypothetical protein WDN31_02545 [Hyphomicrobium sp.]